MAAAAPQPYMHLQHHHRYHQQPGATPKAPVLTRSLQPSHGPASSIVFAPGVVGNAHAITLRLSKSEDERSRRRLYNPRGEASQGPRREASTSHSTNTAHARKSSSSSLPDTRPPSPHLDSIPHLSSSSAPTSRPTSPSPLTIRIRKEDHVAYIEKRARSDRDVGEVSQLMTDALTLAEPTGIDALARAMGRQLRVEGPMDSEDDHNEHDHLQKPTRMRQLELTVETNLFLAEVAKELSGMPDKRPMFGKEAQGGSPGKRKLSVFCADHESSDDEMEDIEGPRRRKIARLPDAARFVGPLTYMSLPLTLAATAALSYLALVRALRWRRYDAVHRKYAHKRRGGSVSQSRSAKDAQSLSPGEAQEIVQLSLGYDMHYIMTMALSFALFKTYGIPSISKLLLATKELSTRENVAKRIIDVLLMRTVSRLNSLLATWTHCPINGHYPGADATPCDPRAMLSMARVNWLHSRYHISNDDFLYTLSLFIFEPLTWAENYGWRPCSELEKHAWFVYWSEIGKRMNIQDIPETLEELKQWSMDYEEKHLVPSPTNFEVAKHSVEEILYRVPNAFGLKRFARRLSVASLIEPALPHVDAISGAIRRMHPRKFPSKPWYMPEPANPLSALVVRIQVWLGLYEAAPGPQLKSEGYYLHEMGPIKFERDGRIETVKAAEAFLGCPVPGPWVKAVGEK
ncbi:hypothetical protein K525DRAFT_191368 [Schizophyllum commune Loenen D]|nr:hypothetical protein K525DRAFT_191368 [Schizophyllum commune Loenen D]